MISKRMSILIADDDRVSRRMLEATLTKWGYEVVVTVDGQEAWAVLERSDAPSLAILDVMMPGIDGFEICRRVRRMARADHTHLILLTSKNSKSELIMGLQAGADDYLTKPFNRDELSARVKVGIRVVELQRALADRVRRLERAEEELLRLSLTDDLTGLYNRRGFLAHTEQHLKTARRTGEESLLFYADMDGLKQINDTLGHEKGSLAIINVAKALKGTFRESDIVARLGGDEFVVLATNVTFKDAESIKSRLRDNLRACVSQDPSNYELALSLGIVRVRSDTNTTIEELIAGADQLMYKNKREKVNLSNKVETKEKPDSLCRGLSALRSISLEFDQEAPR